MKADLASLFEPLNELQPPDSWAEAQTRAAGDSAVESPAGTSPAAGPAPVFGSDVLVDSAVRRRVRAEWLIPAIAAAAVIIGFLLLRDDSNPRLVNVSTDPTADASQTDQSGGQTDESGADVAAATTPAVVVVDLDDGTRLWLRFPADFAAANSVTVTNGSGDGGLVTVRIDEAVTANVQVAEVCEIARDFDSPVTSRGLFWEAVNGDGGDDGSEGNAVGEGDGQQFVFCRLSQSLRMEVDVAAGLAVDPNDFDIVPLACGDRTIIHEPWSEVCQPTVAGPLAVNDVAGVEENGGGDGTASLSSPIVSSAGYYAGLVFAVDAETGVELWSVDIGEESLLIGRTDQLLLVSDRSSLVGLDIADGSEQWRFELDPRASISTTSIVGDTVYVGISYSGDGFNPDDDPTAPQALAIDVTTGDQRWRAVADPGYDWMWGEGHVVGDTVVMTALPTADKPVNGIGDGRVVIWGFDLDDGATRFQHDVGTWTGVLGSPWSPVITIDDRAVVISSVADTVVRIDVADGSVVWRVPVNGRIDRQTDDEIRIHVDPDPDGLFSSNVWINLETGATR